MALNISSYGAKRKIQKSFFYAISLMTIALLLTIYYQYTYASSSITIEPIQACIVPNASNLTPKARSQIAQCLGWQPNACSICCGSYKPINLVPLSTTDEVQIGANQVVFSNQGRSTLSGHVEVQQKERMVTAETAYVYRDTKSNKITKIELLGDVHYIEPERLMIARKAVINPQDKSGQVEDVLYRFNAQRRAAILPSWGRAHLIERFANEDYLLQQATYSTCAPQDNAWQIEADTIHLDKAKAIVVARHAKLRIKNWPLLYTPYLSFPTSKERKSGFLMPTIGTSNIGGFDYAQPYYWNIAPNYDATLIPHLYTRRGLMLGGEFRYLTEKSYGILDGHILPNDRALHQFIVNNETTYPQLRGTSTDRWSVQWLNNTNFNPNLKMDVHFQQVSDAYYLQDFSTNLAILTQRQLLREAGLTYNLDNWLFRAMVQSYQTLNPVNETPILDIYQRLPQLFTQGVYNELPFNGRFIFLGQFDNFHWPNTQVVMPQGPRLHLNPILAFPQVRPWGYFTPGVELVENYYNVGNNQSFFYQTDAFPLDSYPFFLNPIIHPFNPNSLPTRRHFNRTIPRFSLDSGLYFERSLRFMHHALTQTLEPRLYYLNVPFYNQTPIPVYDSAYMIFNTDQLFRTNRFSGFDRIGDANQLAYALSSRLLSDLSGQEKAMITVGQIRYFSRRRVLLCQNNDGSCIDNPLTLGYLSPAAMASPVVGRAVYYFNPAWMLAGGYAWDPHTRATNNGYVNFHYQPALNRIVGLGYTYLVNGDIAKVAFSGLQDNALHQATFSYAWPLNERWSTLGVYNYNLSKNYTMMALAGVQYDSCCWAVRLIGGHVFRSLNTQLQPQYNNNVYLQVLLKGLGSVGNSDPASAIQTYIPGYVDNFHK